MVTFNKADLIVEEILCNLSLLFHQFSFLNFEENEKKNSNQKYHDVTQESETSQISEASLWRQGT